MPTKKENRDYKKEAEREKLSVTVVRVKIKNDKCATFDAKIALEPPMENGKRVTRSYLFSKWIDMYLAGELD